MCISNHPALINDSVVTGDEETEFPELSNIGYVSAPSKLALAQISISLGLLPTKPKLDLKCKFTFLKKVETPRSMVKCPGIAFSPE